MKNNLENQFHKVVYQGKKYDYLIINTVGEMIDLRTYWKYSWFINSRGYLRAFVEIKNGNATRKQVPMLQHKVLMETFVPNQYDKSQVNHIDGNKLNNSLSNLEWVTSKENIEHAIKNGLIKTRLNKEDVIWIRKVFNPDDKEYNYMGLSKLFNVDKKTIRGVIQNKTWKGIGESSKFCDCDYVTKSRDKIDIKWLCDNYCKNKDGFGLKQMAKHFGVSIGLVRNILIEEGIICVKQRSGVLQ